MSLFRRFRRDKENGPADESPETADGEEPTTPLTEEPSPEPTPEAEPTPVAAPEPPAAPAIPPPLPDRPTVTPAPPVSPVVDAMSKCFVCGTPLSGRTCPTCRMTWVE